MGSAERDRKTNKVRPPTRKSTKRQSKGPSVKGTFATVKGGPNDYIQGKFKLRRMLPLTETDLVWLHGFIRKAIRNRRKRYKWFFVALEFTGKGLWYHAAMVAPQPDEVQKTWYHTNVVKSLPELINQVNLQLDKVDIILRGKVAHLTGIKVVLFNAPDSGLSNSPSKPVKES